MLANVSLLFAGGAIVQSKETALNLPSHTLLIPAKWTTMMITVLKIRGVLRVKFRPTAVGLVLETETG